MKRVVLLVALLSFGCLSMALAGFQGPPAADVVAAAKIEKVKDNLYVITGSGVAGPFSGGNTAVFITDNGVVLVDTKLPGLGPTILQRVRSVTQKPITTIINTHTHNDHTGSNEFFFTSPVTSIVQENTKALMAKMPEFSGEKAKFLPNRTYKDTLRVGLGKDEIDLYYFGPGHTGGDTFVVFPALRTMHAGDMFAWKALPFIDKDNNGSVTQHPESLKRAINAIKNVDTVIGGHIPVATFAELKEYQEFSKDFVDFAEKSMKAGKTVTQAAREYKVPEKYKGYVVTVNADYASAPTNLQKAYDELKKK